MRSIFRRVVIVFICLGYFTISAQESKVENSNSFPNKNFTTDLYFQGAIPSGDNFIGNGLSSGTGFGLRLQFYVYRGIYIGGSLAQDFFRVDDTGAIGEFDKATKFNAYFYAGYDYQWNDDWNITADLGYGYSQNKNRQSSLQGGGKFKDTGNVFKISTSLEYALSSGIGVYVSPSFELVSYNIEASPLSGTTFDNGNYINVALGIRFNSRNYNDLPLMETDNQQLLELQSRDREDLSIKEKRALYFLKKRELKKIRKQQRNQ